MTTRMSSATMSDATELRTSTQRCAVFAVVARLLLACCLDVLAD